jgi:hypothetical protein
VLGRFPLNELGHGIGKALPDDALRVVVADKHNSAAGRVPSFKKSLDGRVLFAAFP